MDYKKANSHLQKAWNKLTSTHVRIDLQLIEKTTRYEFLRSGLKLPFQMVLLKINNSPFVYGFYLNENGDFPDLHDPDLFPTGREAMENVLFALASYPENIAAVNYWRAQKMLPYQFYEKVQKVLDLL